jgi:Asp-tRNA(Asn)/Glu-tRNA(Gln) amidotransferase A subunit family amidase
VAVKEEAEIAGQRNTLGSLPLRDAVAEETAAFVQRILDAGGIVHARTTTPEFSCAPVTWSRLWGVTRNPWHTGYSPGGSSGGSAAALAAGTATLATGSDIGGSIRIPVSFCGVVGYKPPYDRVPEMAIFNLDHYCHEGPLARTVTDCSCEAQAYSKKLNYQSGRPDLNRRPLAPQNGGVGVFAVQRRSACWETRR